MEPVYQQNFTVDHAAVDCFGRLKPSMILYYAQEVAGQHFNMLSLDRDVLSQKRMFWAITRHRVQITRLPLQGETIRVETWPMPTTRVAYPRSVVAYDEENREVFRSISLWVLMNLDTRNMILPGKSGIVVSGTVRGNELSVPHSFPPALMQQHRRRAVCFTDLDQNGHMNNTRYADWLDDLIPGAFHREHPVREFTLCYHSEALEGDTLELNWNLTDAPGCQLEALRKDPDETRVFSAKVLFD